MRTLKKYRILVVLLLLLVPVALAAAQIYRWGSHDMQALAGFEKSYGQYDRAIEALYAAVSASPAEDSAEMQALEQTADAALLDLKERASKRITSLIKHEGEIMNTWELIAETSGKELETLKACAAAAASHSPDAGKLRDEFERLREQRKSEFEGFLALGK